MATSEYYQSKLQEGLEYQDFIAERLLEELGITIITYSSKKYQVKKGENKIGIEIKLDRKMKDTSNLYIELAEKTNAQNVAFIDSGVRRKDNSWLYAQGDYNTTYIFSTKQLKILSKKYRWIKISMGTSMGFLLPISDAEKYCIKKIEHPALQRSNQESKP